MSWSAEPRPDLYTPEQIAKAKEFPCPKGSAMSEKYGRLTFVRLAEPKRYKSGTHIRWEMICDCGNTTTVAKAAVRRGLTRSCGCLHRETASKNGKATWIHGVGGNFKHGMSKTPLFRAWARMRQRTSPAGWKHYPRYTGVLCGAVWETFEGFLANQPAGRPYEKGLALARTGDKGNYEPDNCRWATRAENARESSERAMRKLPDGRFARDVATENGISGPVFHGRLYAGWDLVAAATTPPRTKGATA